MRKIHHLFIGLILFLFILIIPHLDVKAETTGKCGNNLTFILSDDKSTLTITGSGDMFDFGSEIVPWIVNGQAEVSKITSVSLPNGLTSIGVRAFEGIGADEIVIPNTVTKINSMAFNKSSIKKLSIPNSVQYIGARAFEDCKNLTGTITIPNSVISFGNGTFIGCSKISGIAFPNSVDVIPDFVCKNCISLMEVNIPKGVTQVGYDAFSGCTSLKSANTPDSITTISQSAFYDCISLTSINLKGCTNICSEAFCNCSSLTSIDLSKCLTIDNRAFYNCSKLTSEIKLDEDPNTWDFIGEQAFLYSGVKKIYFSGKAPRITAANDRSSGELVASFNPSTVLYYVDGKYGWTSPTYKGYKTEKWKTLKGTIFTDTNNIKYKITKTSKGNKNGEVVVIGSKNKKMSSINIHSITIDNITYNIVSIEANAFSGFKKLKSLYISQSDVFTTIKKGAFKNCKKLESVYIDSKKFKTIEKDAFSGCKKLNTLTLNTRKLKTVGKNAFKNCKKLKNISTYIDKQKAYKKLIKKAGATNIK